MTKLSKINDQLMGLSLTELNQVLDMVYDVKTLKKLCMRWDAVMAGAEIGNIDLIEGKISVLCEKMGITVADALTDFTLDESNGIN